MLEQRNFALTTITRNRLVSALLIIAILAGYLHHPTFVPVAQANNPAILDPITLGGLLIAGMLAKQGIDDSLSKVNADARDRFQQASDEIQKIIDLINDKYKDNLSLTLDSVDQFFDGQFTRAYNLILEINQELQSTVGVIEESAIKVIKTAADELKIAVDFIAKKFEQVIVVAAESGVWIVDNIWETIISVVALVFLAALLLIAYTQVGAIIQKNRLPSPARLGFLALFGLVLLAAGLSLLLSKPVRSYVMARTVSALQPRLETNLAPQIDAVIPNTIMTGQAVELKVIGWNLPASKKPTAHVGTFPVPVKISNADQVVLTLAGNATNQEGIQPLTLKYEGLERQLSDVVEFHGTGPDLVVEAISLTPPQPTANDPVSVKIRVKNQGSQVTRFTGNVNFGTTEIPDQSFDQTITLGRGETWETSYSAKYAHANKYVITARITSTTPKESSGPNLDNNTTKVGIEVQLHTAPSQPSATVTKAPTPLPQGGPDPKVCRNKPWTPGCE